MFHFRLSTPYRLWVVVCLGFVALAITFTDQSSLSRAENVAALPVNTNTASQSEPGKPIAGEPATRRVVDLRTLPPAEKGTGKVLPFLFPRGTAALIASQQEALKTPPSNALLNVFSPLAFGAPTIITGFNGINSEQSGGAGGPCFCVPPDGDMSAGPNHVIVGVNQAFRVFNKTGTPLTAPIGYDAFFGSCGASGLTSSDPITAYDPVANRFTVGILRYADSNGPSWISLAVSQSPDPTTTWNQYCFEQRYQDLQTLYDFPHISVGQTALFTTGNLFPPGGAQQVSARVNAFNKQQMYSGAITVTQVYSDVLLNSDMTQADTLRPALFNVGLPSPTNYFINTSSAPNTRSTLWRWTDPFGTNVFVQAGGVDIAPFVQALPMLQPPPGQPMPPAGYIDTRTLGAMWHNGTLYATHAIGCNPGAGATDCIQWWQVGNLNGAPTLIQQGIVGGNNESRAYPNLAVDTNGSVRLSYTFSSLTDFIGVRHTGRLAGDALGTMGPEGVIKAGEQAQVGYNALRYGDYSGSVTDPDGLTLWHFEEYTQAINDPFGSWGTWASSARFPAQATPTSTVTGTPPTATQTSTAGAASATAITTATTTASATATQCASTSTGSIAATDPTQTNRLFRDAITSTCPSPKVCPALNDPVGLPRHYDSYTYTNNTGTQTCITVRIDPMLCNTPVNGIFSAAYLTSFNPANLCQNYLADIGGSPTAPSSYSFIVPAGATFVVIVHEVNPNTGCPAYGISVTGLSCTTPTPTVTGTPPTATNTSTRTITSTQAPTGTATVTPTPIPGGPQFYHNITLDPQRGSGEPSTRVDGHNHAYVSSPFGVGNTSYLWRSQDSSRLTFQPYGIAIDHRIPVAPGGGDTDISVDSANRLHFFDLYLGNFAYTRSDDDGRNFTSQNPIPGVGTVGDDRQWTEAFNDEVYLIYRQIPTGPYANHGIIPVGGGPTIFQPAVLIDNSVAQTSHLGNIVIDKRSSGVGAGNAYVIYNNGMQLRLGRTTDHGATWQPGAGGTPIVIANRSGKVDNIFPVIAVDGAGNLYATWSERTATTYDIFYASSTNQGTTWSTPVRVNTTDLKLNIFPWVVAGSDGRVALAWYGTDAVNNPPNPETVNPATWHGYFALTLNGHDPAPTFTQVRFSQTPIHYNGICLSGTGCVANAGQDRELLDFIEEAVSPLDGSVTIAYADNTNQSGATSPPSTSYLMQAQQIGGNSLFVTSTLTLPTGCVGGATFPCANFATDPTGDAFDPYDGPGSPGANFPLSDLTRSIVGSENTSSITFNMEVNANLATAPTAPRPPGPSTGGTPPDTYTWLTQFEYKDNVYWVAMDWLQGAAQPRFVWGDLARRGITQPPEPGTGLGFFSYRERGTLCNSRYTSGTTPSQIFLEMPLANIVGRDGSTPTSGNQLFNVTSYGFARHGTTNATLTGDIMEIVDVEPPYVYTLAAVLPTPTPGAVCVATVLPTETATASATVSMTGTPPTVAATSTRTVTAQITSTSTAVLPTSTSTVASPTQTPGGSTATLVPTSTSTVLLPTSTATAIVPTGTSTALLPTVTLTRTAVPATGTNTAVASTSTTTAILPTATNTSTATTQPTFTAIPLTSTVVPPSATRMSTTAPTQTPLPTSTRPPTQTPGGPTATNEPSNTPVPTSTPTVAPTSCPLQFTDVPPDQTFYSFIRCLACRGVMSGYRCGGPGEPCDPNNNGYFRPQNDITRGQIAKIVSNAAGFQEDPGPQLYEDVGSINTFYQWINRLSNRGFMGGYPCGSIPEEPCNPPANRPYFRPFANATRGQLAKIVSNAAGVTGTPTGLYYTDVPEDNPFYLWIMRLTNLGVMSGYPCGGPNEPCDDQQRPYFRPFNSVTRGQASKIVANTFYPNCQTPVRSK